MDGSLGRTSTPLPVGHKLLMVDRPTGYPRATRAFAIDFPMTLWYGLFVDGRRTMSRKTEETLFTTRAGRIVIHLACLVHDHKLARHLRGMFREFKPHRA